MEMLLIFVVDHPAADTDFRKNILGVCGIVFQFPSDIGHIGMRLIFFRFR